MLPPERLVLVGRQDYLDAQRLYKGDALPYDFYPITWYGTSISDERGSFAVVDPLGPLAHAVGDILEIVYYPRFVREGSRKTRVYVIGSQSDLSAPMSITRRNYLALELLAIEPIVVSVGPVNQDWGRRFIPKEAPAALRPTTITLVSSPNPSLPGEEVTFTITVAPSDGPGTPTGTVTIFDGTTELALLVLVDGKATFSTSALSTGIHTITVRYSGDAEYAGSTRLLAHTVRMPTTAPTWGALADSGQTWADVADNYKDWDGLSKGERRK